MTAALELRGIVKTFGELRANDGVDLAVEWGRVHALLGENGAGKSTLMNVVYGLTTPDSGEIVFDGRPVVIHGPQDAIRLGIGMVHQHFMLIPPLTVAENIILGQEITSPPGVIDLETAGRQVSELSQRYGLEVPPRARIESLSVGVQQRVEILKALYRGARLLILDEPTAVLTPQEIKGLFEIIRNLVAASSAGVALSVIVARAAPKSRMPRPADLKLGRTPVPMAAVSLSIRVETRPVTNRWPAPST